ncbi:type V CRISPR-associated protein Cas12d [Candidatus Saccharibacteria bacterium]|nr:type V CRISPR-associated protein Cas12d [Candidatus Saccharibacteria bacterium]MCL1963022.1 type V CRISPR-associated protein Cas12d [Candidatus Saccharibacteria bacterium]
MLRKPKFDRNLRKNEKRKNGKRGYRLHDERIAYSGGEGSMRTIKYELLNTDATRDNLGRGTGLQAQVFDAIERDYEHLYGALNFNDYLENPDTPNFLDLWIKAINLGFILSNKCELEYKDFLKIESWQEKYFGEIEYNLAQRLDKKKWVKWLDTPVRPASGTQASLARKITDLFDNVDDAANEIARKWLELCGAGTQNNTDNKLEIFGINAAELDIKIPETAPINWTIHPEFTPFDIADRTDLLDAIIKYWKEKVGDATAKKFIAIGENGNHMNNGLFGEFFTTLCSENWNEKVENLRAIFDFSDDQIATICERLNELKKCAEQIPKAPSLIRNWKDYRSDFNGTIESWYSNRDAKQLATIEQLKTLRELAGEIYEDLPMNCDIREGILRETIDYIDGEKSANITREFTNELESYLATLKTDLNEFMQRFKDGKTQKYSADAPKLPPNWQLNLSKHIQSSPLFFGENKRQLWRDLVELKPKIRAEIANLTDVLVEDFDDGEITDKQIDQLANLYNRLNEDKESDQNVKEVLTKIQDELELNFVDRRAGKDGRVRNFYYLSGFNRATDLKNLLTNDGKMKSGKNEYIKFNRIKISQLLEVANLGELYQKVSEKPEQENLLRDVVQLSKTILSAKLVNCDREKQRKTVLSHSNLHGYSALISKREFIARSAVQAVNGAQMNFLTANDKYFYALQTERFETNDKISADQVYDFSAKEMTTSNKNNEFTALKVASSKYQVQFLDWFLGKNKKKKTILELNGAFSITEQSVKIDWSDEKPKVASTSDPRVFISQPFTLVPPKTKLFDAAKIKNRYIGVDLGEYNLAWSLIEVDDMQNPARITQIENGFIVDPQQQTVKKYVKSWRENQVRQTFGSMDTKLARLRESLIGSFKNQLESLALAKHARLSFEYEVSVFETGGSRVAKAKVYDSVKRGSIRRDENTVENKQAWGEIKKPQELDKNSPLWAKLKEEYGKVYGFETTAAWTSRFCTKCRTVADNWLNEDENFYAKCRPNLATTEYDDLPEAIRNKLTAEEFAEFRKENESSIALFVCSNPDCDQVCDADAQAAFNIAIRGYLKDKSKTDKEFCSRLVEGYKDEKDKPVVKLKNELVESGLTKEILVSEEAKLEFDPICL